MTERTRAAEKNLVTRLEDNPCRGIVVGMDEQQDLVQLAWIMGRSAGSQNRIYITDGNGTLSTEPADESKVEDRSLTIYNAMRTVGATHIVSNGAQTDTVEAQSGRRQASRLQEAMGTHHCEPDGPIFTPRITGLLESGRQRGYLSLLRAKHDAKAVWQAAKRENMKSDKARIDEITGLNHQAFPTTRELFTYDLEAGFGYALTTYKPGSQTLESFEGEPFKVPLRGNIGEIMNHFWEALEPAWRVSLGAKWLDRDNGHEMHMPPPINLYEKVLKT